MVILMGRPWLGANTVGKGGNLRVIEGVLIV